MSLTDRYLLRPIRPEETEEAADIEEICFPPNEACSRASMRARVAAAPETFLVAEDRRTGRLAGFLNGIATDERAFRDEFFTDASLHNPAGRSLMLLGLDVLPAHRGQGLARLLVSTCRAQALSDGRERLVLTCLNEKVEMYRKLGFQDLGLSASVWGGERWHEMEMRLREAARI